MNGCSVEDLSKQRHIALDSTDTLCQKELDVQICRLRKRSHADIPMIDVLNGKDECPKTFFETWKELQVDFPPLDRMLSEIAGSIAISTVVTMQHDPDLHRRLSRGDCALRCYFDDEARLEQCVRTQSLPQVDVCLLSDVADWATNDEIYDITHDLNFLFVLTGVRQEVSENYSMFLAFPKTPEKMFGDAPVDGIPILQLTKCHNPACNALATRTCHNCSYLRCCHAC